METMESLLGEQECMKLHIGMIVEATVVEVTDDEVVVDFGYQSEGSVAFDQWTLGGTKDTVAPTVKPGDKVTLKVIASENPGWSGCPEQNQSGSRSGLAETAGRTG